MKKYLILITMVLLSVSVQAKQKGLMETINSVKKTERSVSHEDIQMQKRMNMERMKENYLKKYTDLSKEELEKRQKTAERRLKTVEPSRKRVVQVELEALTTLLNQKKQ